MIQGKDKTKICSRLLNSKEYLSYVNEIKNILHLVPFSFHSSFFFHNTWFEFIFCMVALITNYNI